MSAGLCVRVCHQPPLSGSTPKYGSAFLSTSAHTGPESAPPLVVQLWGSSKQISTAIFGSSMGATDTKLAMRAPSLALSSFWLVPLLPPMR